MRYVDGTKIKEYLTCPRAPYLAFRVPREDEAPPTERMEILFESGHRVEAVHLEEIGPERIEFPRGDWDAGFQATLDAMDRKVPAIAEGVLKLGEFLGRPDLLVFNAHEGRYEVADVKSSQVVHSSARLQVAFYSRMLGQIRPAPRRGWIIVRDGTRVGFEIADLMASVERLLDILQRFRAPDKSEKSSDSDADPGPHLTESCGDCRYREVCLPELEERGDVSLTPGLTRAQAAALRTAGVTTLEELARPGDLRRLVKETSLSTDAIRRLARAAQAVRAGRPERYGVARRELADAKFAVAALFIDRQTAPEIAVAGKVLGDGGGFKVRFLRAPESEDPLGELRTFVFNLVKTDGPVLTFGPSVPRLLDRLVVTAPSAIEAVQRLRDRMIDVRAELRRAVQLPGVDRTPALAARAAGLMSPDDGPDLAALRYLEGAGGTKDALEALLRRDIDAIERLRDFAVAEPGA